ncbi:hypothetical protein K502DRAFT_350999 [Neoconidiobolus thromboides FSU 785]|nr:hypothetical protein K502DRAFT_350999 [Neoconidiobolus thromboides FSU 785]
MIKFLLFSIFLIFIQGELKCPDPENTPCYTKKKRDKFGDMAKCLGYGCSPCWKKEHNTWVCYERHEIDCSSSGTIDLDDYERSCKRYEREDVLDIGKLLNEKSTLDLENLLKKDKETLDISRLIK